MKKIFGFIGSSRDEASTTLRLARMLVESRHLTDIIKEVPA